MKLELTDLRNITRRSDKVKTVIKIANDDNNFEDWLILGEVQISRRIGEAYYIDAYLTKGVCDFEHDSAYAFRIPLIGLYFDSVYYHTTILTAWIDPNDNSQFSVPRPGYNPMELPNTYMCDDECCEKPHPIVPEEYYTPPDDKELFEEVRGKKIKIYIMPEEK